MSVALAGSVLGVLSLVCLCLAWTGSRRAVLPLAALRLVSALTAAPAFFAADVPAAIRVLAGVVVLLTVVGIALVVGTRDAEPVQA
jgi:hypothetical protein